MEIFEAIMTRRSIRRFTNQKVSAETVKKILEAGMMAPSVRNYQSWFFIVIDDRSILDKVPEIHPHAKMLREAPLAILVCGDKNKEKEPAYVVQNCAAVTQNILLAAHALHLGAVWLGILPREPRMQGMRKLCNLPNFVQPVSLIALGYPDEKKLSESRYDQAKVKYNKWNE